MKTYVRDLIEVPLVLVGRKVERLTPGITRTHCERHPIPRMTSLLMRVGCVSLPDGELLGSCPARRVYRSGKGAPLTNRRESASGVSTPRVALWRKPDIRARRENYFQALKFFGRISLGVFVLSRIMKSPRLLRPLVGAAPHCASLVLNQRT